MRFILLIFLILICEANLIYGQDERIDRLSPVNNFYNKFGNRDTVCYYINKALETEDAINALNAKMVVYKSKAAVCAANKQFDSAYFNFVKYVRVRDSLIDKKKVNHVARLQTFYEAELLQKKNEAAASQLRQRNAVIIIVGTLFILSIAATGALYKQRKTQQHINKLLIAKNDHIRKQSEEIHFQSEKVSKLNKDLGLLNENLERKIRCRTRMLQDQNKLLAEYAHSNAHELRAPVASVMGLVDLLKRSTLAREEMEIVRHLSKSASQLDVVVRDIRIKLERSEILFFDERDISENN